MHTGNFCEKYVVKWDSDIMCFVWQVHISHIGKMSFKGLAEPQAVMQFNTAHLAARQFPAEPPSAKAVLVCLCCLWYS